MGILLNRLYSIYATCIGGDSITIFALRSDRRPVSRNHLGSSYRFCLDDLFTQVDMVRWSGTVEMSDNLEFFY